jgi:hypothetical protein
VQYQEGELANYRQRLDGDSDSDDEPRHRLDAAESLRPSANAAGREEPPAGRPVAPGGPDRGWPPNPDEISIVVLRAVQAGEDSRQLDAYEFRIASPDVDFSSILKRHDVREALRRLAQDPHSQWRRDTVISAIGASSWLRSWHGPVLSYKVPPADPSGRDPTDVLDGCIIVSRCDGVQIGEGDVQRNRFTYRVLNTKIDAVQLLQDNPRVVEALIDVVVYGEGPERLNDAVRDALNGPTDN